MHNSHSCSTDVEVFWCSFRVSLESSLYHSWMLLYFHFPCSNNINRKNCEYRITPFTVADQPPPPPHPHPHPPTHLLLITGLNFNTQVHKTFHKSSRHFKIPDVRRVTQRKLHTGDHKISGTNVQYLVNWVTQCPGFVQPHFSISICLLFVLENAAAHQARWPEFRIQHGQHMGQNWPLQHQQQHALVNCSDEYKKIIYI